MSNSQASGSGVGAKSLVYERYCRTFNKSPIPVILEYAKTSNVHEKKVLNERLDEYERNPTAANRENIHRNFSDFSTSVALDQQYRAQQKRSDGKKNKSKPK